MKKDSQPEVSTHAMERLRRWWRRRVDSRDPSLRPGERAGLWNRFYNSQRARQMYSDDRTAKLGGAFLDVPEVRIVEDWGCGLGGFKPHLRADQTYIGVDGSETPYADKIVDLVDYTSVVDGIFMRGVIEHNPSWDKILKNALASFRHRMVLVLFTPFARRTKVIRDYPDWWGTGVTMVDIAFARDDLTRYFSGLEWSVEANLKTKSQYKCEHIFYLRK